MSIIDTTYFVGENNIPNLTGNDSSVTEGNILEVQRFINIYEPKYLVLVLDEQLAEDFIAGLEEDPVPEKWSALKAKFADPDTLESVIADYVFFRYAEYRRSIATPEIVKSEYALFSTLKMVNAWNRMVAATIEIGEFILDNLEDYPIDTSREFPFGIINEFGI